MHYILVFVILIVSSFFYYKLAVRFNIVDKPNHRSSHSTVTVRGGGIIFLIALLIYSLFNEFDYPLLLLSALLIGGLSFIDDLRPLPPSLRFPFQCIAVILIMFQVGFDLDWIFLGIIFVISVGFVNAFNFMDGINGITGLYSLTILLFSFIFNKYFINFTSEDLLIFLIFSVIIFCFYNFRKKAIFFAGDVGSITMAICILFIVLSIYNVTNAISVFLILGVYGIDSAITILRRIKLKEKITDAHRHHLYQHLVDSKLLTHLQVSTLYAFVQSILCLVFIYSLSFSFLIQLVLTVLILIFLIAIYFVSLRTLKRYQGL